jgi:hypothetical protein
MVASALLFSLAAAAMAAPPPPPTWVGPGFVCRMVHGEGGGAFTLAGSFGTGRRFDGVTANPRRNWVYTFPDARIADSEIRFSGPAMDARTGMLGAFDALAGAGLSIAYPRTGGGMELVIEGAAAASRPARLLGYRHGERVARGTCTLVPAGSAASSPMSSSAEMQP